MSDDEDKEYEVESVTQAKIVKKRKQLIWNFHVRWKGYPPDEDTWEPIESFSESQQIIDLFWERANSGGRDWRNLSLFKPGESFVVTGPPRRKIKRKSLPAAEVEAPEELSPGPKSPQQPERSHSALEKRRRVSSSDVEDSESRPNKRTRGRVSEPAPKPQTPATEKKRIPLPRRANCAPAKPALAPTESPPRSSPQKPRKTRRSPSIEVVPDSDEEIHEVEMQALPPPTIPTSKSQATHLEDGSTLRRNIAQPIASGSNQVELDHRQDDDVFMLENEEVTGEFDPLFDTTETTHTPRLPSHRARAAKPLVKLVDDYNVTHMDGAIAVKARFLTRGAEAVPVASPGASSSRPAPKRAPTKPGPGRSSNGMLGKNKSSLLTFDKGVLKTVKGKYTPAASKPRRDEERSPEVEVSQGNGHWDDDLSPELPEPISHGPPPTGEELLELAGLDVEEAEALPDFEDDTPVPMPEEVAPADPAPQPVPEKAETIMNQSLALAATKLFPNSTSNTVTVSMSPGWQRSTIFGPLGLGVDSIAKSTTDAVTTSPFLLSVDPTTTIPVALTDTSSGPRTFNLVAAKGTPGKFYRDQAALSLLNTLRATGPSARVIPNTNASDDDKRHFEQFRVHLDTNNELFVGMVGSEFLAFCSSSNALMAQRLNVPAILLATPNCVLISKVEIADYTAYADVAMNTDPIFW